MNKNIPERQRSIAHPILPLAMLLTASLLAGCSVKPQLIGSDEMNGFVTTNAEQLVANQEPVSGAIGLYEAMARALKYNLDHRVEMMNVALAARVADVKSAAMLPQVVAASGYNGRDPSAGIRCSAPI